MILNLFDQFASPYLLGLPLILIAMFVPWFLLPTPSKRWTTNRMNTMVTWLLNMFTKQMFYPLSKKGHKWALMLMALMTFLLSMNTLGLLPYTFTPTTQLSFNLGLAVPFWLATVLIGLRNQTTFSLAHLLPQGTPTPLIPVLIIIETISLLIRPLALGVRLTANITAGHLLIHLISISLLSIHSILVFIPTFIVLILLTILELAVAVIQAYVFVLLLTLYLQENT